MKKHYRTEAAGDDLEIAGMGSVFHMTVRTVDQVLEIPLTWNDLEGIADACGYGHSSWGDL